MIGKIFTVVAVAFFVQALIYWMLFSIPPGVTVSILALLYSTYALVKNFTITLYLEQNPNGLQKILDKLNNHD